MASWVPWSSGGEQLALLLSGNASNMEAFNDAQRWGDRQRGPDAATSHDASSAPSSQSTRSIGASDLLGDPTSLGPNVLSALKSGASAAAAATGGRAVSRPLHMEGSGTAALLSRTGLVPPLSRPSVAPSSSSVEESPTGSDESLGFGSVFSGDSTARMDRIQQQKLHAIGAAAASYSGLGHEEQHEEVTVATPAAVNALRGDEAIADDILAARSLSTSIKASASHRTSPEPSKATDASQPAATDSNEPVASPVSLHRSNTSTRQVP